MPGDEGAGPGPRPGMLGWSQKVLLEPGVERGGVGKFRALAGKLATPWLGVAGVAGVGPNIDWTWKGREPGGVTRRSVG